MKKISDMKVETEKIVNFIKTTFREKGFEKAVIGISGGIDSTVTAYLTVQALGKDNVKGILLPCSEQHDIEDSMSVVKALGIQYEIINIGSIVKDFETTSMPEHQNGNKSLALRIGNVKARTRMIVLYDKASYYNGLVVGTSNKTELYLGYFTIYGDGACALEPIGHLLKTEVFILGKYLKIPKAIVEKAPSAGLWKGQTDEQELGFKYKDIDNFIEKYDTCLSLVHNGYHPSKFDIFEELEDGNELKLLQRVYKNSFKMLPPNMITKTSEIKEEIKFNILKTLVKKIKKEKK